MSRFSCWKHVTETFHNTSVTVSLQKCTHCRSCDFPSLLCAQANAFAVKVSDVCPPALSPDASTPDLQYAFLANYMFDVPVSRLLSNV